MKPQLKETSSKDLLELYRQLIRSRLIQEKLQYLFKEKILTSHLYLELGEEAITVGCDAALEKDDFLAAYWRGDSSCLLRRGMSLKSLMAWWLGRKPEDDIVTTVIPTSYGNIGMHLLPRCDSCLGSEMDIAAGAALAARMKGKKQAVAVMFGEGATNRSNFHESLTFSAVLRLPLVYICRVNGWAMSTPTKRTIPVEHVAAMSAAYGIKAYTVDGNDVVAVRETVKQALEYSRNGGGPVIIEARTYRMGPHSGNDEDDYRPAGEKDSWQKRDPLTVALGGLREQGIGSETTDKIHTDCQAEIEAVTAWALQRPCAEVERNSDFQQGIVNKMWRKN